MKPAIITQIEKITDFELHEAPVRQGDTLSALMRYKSDPENPDNPWCKYAIDGERLIGLNLANTGLTNETWRKIVDLEDFEPAHLQALNLSGNQLSDSFDISEMPNLLLLDLSENKLKEFSLPAVNCMAVLNLEENPLESPPQEILKQGQAATLRFLQQLAAQGEREVYEVKMLIVGEGETGKTTLWNLMQDPNHPVPDEKQKTTVGIGIKEGWKFTHLDRPGVDFYVNLWDFGGQEIQYMTHQFFLTRRSLYVLLADGRREVANFMYWFKIINLLGCDPESTAPLPVLVVLNEKGNPITRMPYDPEEVKKDFPNLQVVKREVDFKIKDDGRLTAVVDTVKDMLCRQMAHLPLRIPALWDKVRSVLFDLRESENHINFVRYKAICQGNGINDEQQMLDLSRLLHDLGVILHFYEVARLKDFIVLNPTWAVNAVYELLRHEVVAKNQGRFSEDLLMQVWDVCGYSAEEQGKLLNLMLKDSFEVCFKAKEHGKHIYIAPQLLPEHRPADLDWLPQAGSLHYAYHYPFMPKGIIGRLIVQLHENLESREGAKVVWEKGMIWAKNECRALVQQVEDKKGRQLIKIEVQGDITEDRKNTLQDIRRDLDKIHSDSFPTLKVFQMVSCCCEKCTILTEPAEYELNSLLEMRALDVVFAQCPTSYKQVSVLKLLEQVIIMEHTVKARKIAIPGQKKIFFSYSNADREYMDELLKHLDPLRRSGKIEQWNDANIPPGEEWDEAIRRELYEAHIILLLVSADFLAANYVHNVEIAEAMARHERREARVIPIILRECDWVEESFSKLNVLPIKGKAVTDWDNRDKAWAQVVKGIKSALDDLDKNTNQ